MKTGRIQGGRARRGVLPLLPVGALEAAAHEQRGGVRKPREKAPQLRGAGVPVGEAARAPGRGRDVRAGQTAARFALLRLRQDAGAVRRKAEEGARSARQARRRPCRGGHEDDTREPRACGEGGCVVARPLGIQVWKKAEAPRRSDSPFLLGPPSQRLARTAYIGILDTIHLILMQLPCS